MTRFINTILFDLTHTLIYPTRTWQSHMACTYAVLAPHCWALDFETFAATWERVGMRYDTTFQEGVDLLRAGDIEEARAYLHEPYYRANITSILAELNIDTPDELIEQLTDAFQTSWAAGVIMSPDTPTILAQIAAEGYKLGIVTNFQQPDLVPDLLARFGLTDYFDSVIISAEVSVRKPHPDIFRAALDALELADTPERVAYVGDNPLDDIEGASMVGLRPIFIDSRGYPTGCADTIPHIEGLDELPRALAALNARFDSES